MRRLVAVFAWAALAACSSSSAAVITPSPSPAPSPSVNRLPTSDAQIVAGGCGGTQVYKGGEPAWLTDAGAGNNPNDLPYAITYPPDAAGFIFGYPLRAGKPTNPSNKILWVVGIPRGGYDLRITGHPLNASTPTIDLRFPDNAGPGEIYPSGVDVPQAGCWHFDLAWGANRTGVDLVYA